MEVKNIEDFPTTTPIFMVSMYEDILKNKGIDGSFNYVEIEAGAKVPEEGHSIHDHDELSIVIEGNLEVEIENEIYHVKSGDYTLIPKGMPHISKNLDGKKCTIVSLLI